MQGPLNIAVAAARAAGNIMLRNLDRLDALKISEKSHNDFVSEVDHQCEVAVIDTIRKAYPDHGFLGEEGGQQGEGDDLWIIDPLDGTLNYLRGIPQFAVSIALQHKHRTEVGVVYDPLKQELFVATRGSVIGIDTHACLSYIIDREQTGFCQVSKGLPPDVAAVESI